jgi:hypothetical protein
MFFSEEKNQKTFASWCCRTVRGMPELLPRGAGNKSLLVLFFRKQHSYSDMKQMRVACRYGLACQKAGFTSWW